MKRPWPALLAVLLAACSGPPPDPREHATFVGRATCAGCHSNQNALWFESHHDLAMEKAGAGTVLGDFGGAVLEHRGDRFRFHTEGDRFLVDAPGPDGEPGTYEVAWTFGVTPLQQYLVPFPEGRVQALPVAWDSRPAHQGGQRWYSLYPDENVPAGDALHWTGPNQRWNWMCADCHSTGLRRGYDPRNDRYDTRWEEIDVSCEACHGPGSQHVDWALGQVRDDGKYGLTHSLKDSSGGLWEMDPETGNARRTAPRTDRTQTETCARCHSRRGLVHEDVAKGQPLLDDYRLSLLEEGLYHPDGQILEEVYVHGSFLQSRMYAEGVTCTDCHDPHTLELLFPGDALCARCHDPAKYRDFTHHRHAPDGPGSACVDCHMPETTYMVVDPRRDHSLRVPRPDLTVSTGSPNACNGCHTDRDAAWAAEAVAEWFPGGRHTEPHYGEAFHAARRGVPGSVIGLVHWAVNPEAAGIVRATAVTELGRRLDPTALSVVQASLQDPDPLVRAAALGALEALPAVQRMPMAFPALEDPVRLVRLEAARVLTEVPSASLRGGGIRILEEGYEEYEQSLRANADRAEAQLGLGLLFSARGRDAAAESAYRRGTELDPTFAPCWVNLAELLRNRGDEATAERVLRRGIEAGGDASLHHALGLALVRQGKREEALAELARAADLAPERTRYAYVQAVAMRELGDAAGSLAVLHAAYQRRPHDRDVLQALATFLRDDGDREGALRFAEELARVAPGDPGVQELLRGLR